MEIVCGKKIVWPVHPSTIWQDVRQRTLGTKLAITLRSISLFPIKLVQFSRSLTLVKYLQGAVSVTGPSV